jgi:hypothetical protein
MADNPDADPAPQSSKRAGPAHQQLHAFLGTWKTEGRTVAGGGTPAVSIESNDEYELMPGGFFVVHRWDGRVGSTEVHGIEIIGYDAASGAYRTHFFDNDGNAGSEELTVRDRTWTWVGKQVMGSDWHRCTSVVSEDGNTMRAKHERSTDGKVWLPWMDVTLRRVA